MRATPRTARTLLLPLFALALGLLLVAACDGDGDGPPPPSNLTDPSSVPTATPWTNPPEPIILEPDSSQFVPTPTMSKLSIASSVSLWAAVSNSTKWLLPMRPVSSAPNSTKHTSSNSPSLARTRAISTTVAVPEALSLAPGPPGTES